MSFLTQLFSSGDFQPHGFCYAWNSRLVWLHVFSDVLIAASYFVIPLILLWIVRQRRDIPFSWMFALFGAFIVACGATHIMEVWNLWHAQYWLAGAIKALTAAASLGTAVVLSRIAPLVVKVPNLSAWAKANADLEVHVAERTRELSLANDELRDSRETFRLAQKAGRIGTWEIDLATNTSKWTSELDEIFGVTLGPPSQDSAARLRQRVHPDDIPALDAARATSLRDGSDYLGDFRIILPDGGVRWITARGSVICDATGKPQRLVGVTVDVTQERRAAEEIRALNATLESRVADRTRDLSNANKELESFSYSVSHDLRAPLRTIDGFSLALLEDCNDALDEVGKGHLLRIRNATQRMGALIDDLLNLSRVTRAQLNSQTFDLSAIVASVAREMHAAQPQRQVVWHIQPGVSATGDAQLLKVAIENLLNNAWKFTSRLASASIAFGKTENNGSSAFFVKDDGAGFDPVYADRLFGAFQRLHATAEFPGTGVGLATVQRVIHRHGGRIWAESAIDRGATFYFTLPQSGSQGANE